MRTHGAICLVMSSLFCAGATSQALVAPEAQTPADTEPVTTLHATTTLVEIPLLVLDQSGQPLRTASPGSIQLRLGDGDWFRPNYVRQEGQDPIEVAILLDLTSRVSYLSQPLAQALASPGSLGLTSRDHVSLYAMDCSSVRVTNIPADPAQVDAAVRSAVVPPGQSDKGGCKEGGRLLDTLAAMSRILRNIPSRRVILAITEGKDHMSAVSPKSLAELAQSCAVTIVQLNPTDTSMFAGQNFHGFPLIAEATGGTRLGIQADAFRTSVHSAIDLLRNRYIAQFQLRPEMKAGRVAIAGRIATMRDGTYQIRFTGNSVPLPNPAGIENAVAQPVQPDHASTATTVPTPRRSPASTISPPSRAPRRSCSSSSIRRFAGARSPMANTSSRSRCRSRATPTRSTTTPTASTIRTAA